LALSKTFPKPQGEIMNQIHWVYKKYVALTVRERFPGSFRGARASRRE
jgi:hypothetical protein